MFEQSFVRPQSRVRTGWTVIASTGLQAVGLTAAIMLPLLSPDLLPRVVADSILLAPPGPPPGRPPSTAGATRTRALSRHPAPLGLYAPVAVPERTATIVEEPDRGEPAGDEGVPGGIPQTGPQSSVLAGIIQGARAPAPQEKTEAPLPVKPEAPRRIVMVSQLEQGMVLERVQPVYPPAALHLRIQGTVHLRTIVGTDGRVKELTVVSGHPMLVQAAAAAVRQWRYRPTVLNGEAVEVVAPVEVHFTLAR